MGIIFHIQRFSVNDGPGIRTTVFMKSCPLRCAWCHNPESTVRAPEMMFNGEKCVLCGRCVPGCERGCHTVTEDAHLLNRADCIGCGACVPVGCEALELCGRERSVEEVLEEVTEKQHVPADVSAIKFFLMNKARKDWQNDPERLAIEKKRLANDTKRTELAANNANGGGEGKSIEDILEAAEEGAEIGENVSGLA